MQEIPAKKPGRGCSSFLLMLSVRMAMKFLQNATISARVGIGFYSNNFNFIRSGIPHINCWLRRASKASVSKSGSAFRKISCNDHKYIAGSSLCRSKRSSNSR